jgi:hypothetical protein
LRPADHFRERNCVAIADDGIDIMGNRFAHTTRACLPEISLVAAIFVDAVRCVQRARREAAMGDKSPKSKRRGQQQKNAAKAENAATAKSKQYSQSRVPQTPGRGTK